MILMFQGQVKSKHSRSKKLLFLYKCLYICVYLPLRLFCDTTDHIMYTAGRLTKQAGQDTIVFTGDEQLYRVAVNISGGAAKKVVARVKAEATEELYANLETSEGQKDIYRIATARNRAGKDIGHMRTIKSATGDVLMRDEDIRERWGQYFSWLMNEENPRVETDEREPNQGLTAPINEAETERALKGMKSGKAVGSDDKYIFRPF